MSGISTTRALLRVGTRGSALASAQAEGFARALRATTGIPVELVMLTTHGDLSPEPLAQIGGTGVFVSALRAALLDGTVDVAVHSMKDLPTGPADGLALAAVPVREDPRDVLVAGGRRHLDDLPARARIGTGSLRRGAQLRAAARAAGRDVQVVDVRGNVDTRLRRVAQGDLDAVVLARAGLARLGRLEEVTQTFDPEVMTPAPGQGALAVETRSDGPAREAVAALDDLPTRLAVTAERALLAALEAGCAAPVGALAVLDGPVLALRAVVSSLDGLTVLRRARTTPVHTVADAAAVGVDLARDLLADDAARLLPVPTGSVAREHP